MRRPPRFDRTFDVSSFLKGNLHAPIYSEPVSLQFKASIIEHLVELLGTDDQLAFTVEWASSDRRVLHFERVTRILSGGPV